MSCHPTQVFIQPLKPTRSCGSVMPTPSSDRINLIDFINFNLQNGNIDCSSCGGSATPSGLIQGVTYNTASDSLVITDTLGNTYTTTIPVVENPSMTPITQVAHGLVVPAQGFLPVTYNTASNVWEDASTTNGTTLHDSFLVGVVDANTFLLQHSGPIEVVGHGLTVGQYYFLQDNGSIGLVPDGDFDDVLVFPYDNDTILLLSQRPLEDASGSGGGGSASIQSLNYDNITGVLTLTDSLGTDFTTNIPTGGSGSVAANNGTSNVAILGVNTVQLGGPLTQPTVVTLGGFDLDFMTGVGTVNINTNIGQGVLNIDGPLHLTTAGSYFIMTSTTGATTWRVDIDDSGLITTVSI